MDANFIWVLVGCALIGAGASLVGTFTYLRKEALVGDAIAHALLPGVALAFIIFEEKSLVVLFPGAVVAGLLSMWSISIIQKRSKLKSDAAIAIVLSVFFAVGIVLLTHIQQGSYGNQSGLSAFIFGKAASMLPRDIYLFIGVDVALIGCIWLFYPYLKLFSFDKEFAQTVGLPVRFLQFLLSVLTVLAIATGIQAVGVVLMAALIITPAAAARFMTKELHHMIFWAILLGIISAISGVLISYMLPSMPTGPWIVVVLSMLAIAAFFFSPSRGIVSRNRQRIQHQRKITEENVIKLLYYLQSKNDHIPIEVTALASGRKFDGMLLGKALKRLEKNEIVTRENDTVTLTDSGMNEGRRIVRLHRLWELYLNVRMDIAEDHVHHDAEAIEHIITPELELALLKDLDYPELDPHMSEIPGVKELRP